MLALMLLAGAGALASLLGGLAGLWRSPSPAFMSNVLGFTGGILIGTVAFEMIDEAIELNGLGSAAGGFSCGFLLIYGIDLLVNRGATAGRDSDHRERVKSVHKMRSPRGGPAAVLVIGTAIQEWIEGFAITIGMQVDTGVAIVLAITICIFNFVEGLSISLRIRSKCEPESKPYKARVIAWTGFIGASLFVASLVGALFLTDAPQGLLAFLLTLAGGGLLYLAVTDLLPESQQRQYQQTAAIATGIGFVTMLVLSRVV